MKTYIGNRYIAYLAVILTCTALYGCGVDTESSDANSNTSDDIVSTEQETLLAEVSANIDRHPDNQLMAVVSINNENTAIKVTAQYFPSSLGESSSAALTTQTSEYSQSPTLTLVGFRANTHYDIQLTFEDEDGNQSTQSLGFTSGSLPVNAPNVTVITPATEETTQGITLFGYGVGRREDAEAPLYYGVDNEGFVVWYLHGTSITSTSAVARHISGNQFYIFDDSGLMRIDSEGNQLEVYALGDAAPFHHDALILPNGHRLALTQSVQTINGESITGDIIIEVDSNGAEVWRWSTFDHLDTLRFPGPLSTRTNRSGALDWTHANAIYFDEASNQILLSLRSQSWVVNIDRTTGDIVWIMGNRDSVSADFDAPFLDLIDGSWMANQHAATLTKNGQILVYDNANETDGPALNSRAVLFTVNPELMTATQSWEQRSTKYTSSLGDVDELDNGNILINSGGPGSISNGRIIESHRSSNNNQGEIVWEIEIDSNIYRAEKISWSSFLSQP